MTAFTAAPVQPDNLFGICHRASEDLGINPLWLRIGFGAALVFAPVAVIAAYFALGVIVVSSRLLFPDRRPAPAAPVVLPMPLPRAAEPAPLPLAA